MSRDSVRYIGAAMKAKKGMSAYDAALFFLTPRARTVRETENYLDSQQFSEFEIMQTIERLKASGLLNDAKYAADFIETRLNTKPVSRMKLRIQLEGHCIPNDVIEDALRIVDEKVELSNARSVAEKFYRQFSELDSGERLRRIQSRLVSRGYSFSTIQAVIDELEHINR